MQEFCRLCHQNQKRYKQFKDCRDCNHRMIFQHLKPRSLESINDWKAGRRSWDELRRQVLRPAQWHAPVEGFMFFSLKHKNWLWFKHKGLRITRAGVKQAAGGLWKYVRQLERQVPGIRSLTEHQLATSYPISTEQQKVVHMIFLNSPKVSKNISVGCGGLQRASDMIKDWHLWRVILFIFKAEVCAVLKWRDKEALVSSR